MFQGVDILRVVDSPSALPLRNSPDQLYQAFQETHEEYRKNQQRTKQNLNSSRYEEEENSVFELAHEFECLTSAHLKVLIDLRSRRSLTEEDSKICQKLEIMLNEERNTWRLANAIFRDQLQSESKGNDSNRMDDCIGLQNGSDGDTMFRVCTGHSEEQVIANYYAANDEIRRMQLVADWLEANVANDLDQKDEEDRVEFYSDSPTAWENTFHAMRAKYNINISSLDITINPNAGLDLCDAMDPDAPLRTKKSLAHSDKEVEIKLFKHLFRFVRAGKLDEGQQMAQRVGYHWLSAVLDGWLLYSDPNLEEEDEKADIHQPLDVRPVSGNKKRDVWKQTCFKCSRMQGLTSYEKAISGLLGGNLKSVLPVCHSWSDQLWARLRCSIDVLIEKALRDPNIAGPDIRSRLIEYPQEFYDNYQNVKSIFESIRDLKIISPYKEATIHQTVQKHIILNDMEGLLNQLQDWCRFLDYDNNFADNDEAISPQFLRFFAHIILFLRELDLITSEDPRATLILESYISLLTQHKSIESVTNYTLYLPKDNQTISFAKLLATIDDREERRQCLNIAKDSGLDVDEITQTVVEMIRDEPCLNTSFNATLSDFENRKLTSSDKRKIDALDYLLYLEPKNYVAILHHGNAIMRLFALQRKMESLKETFLKLPHDLIACVENQWRVHTNSDINQSLRNNIRELEGFRVLLECQEELSQWSEWHHKKPEEPKRPANLKKFCDNVNYEQRLKQYQQDVSIWEELREVKTNSLTSKISELFQFPQNWMRDLATPEEEVNASRIEQLNELRKIYIPQMTTICFNVLQLTNRYEDCLKVAQLLASDDLKLHEELTQSQVRDFLDKLSEVVKIIARKTLNEA